jgi:hypothetical protein
MKFIPMMLILCIAMMVVAGAVVDGDGKTQTLQQALTIAQGAARAGTNAATGNSVNGDAFNLSPDAAVTAAENYINAAGVHGNASIIDNQVYVTVEQTYTPKILGGFGVGPMPVHATASARLVDH